MRPRTGVAALSLFLLACSGPAPDPLERLLLATGSTEIGPVDYPHGLHLDPGAMGERLPCARCHHPVADRPGAVPEPCSSCHPREPEEGRPPDL